MADSKFRTEIVADPVLFKAGMAEAARIAQQTAQSMAASMASAAGGMQTSMQRAMSGIASGFAKLNSVAGYGALLAAGTFTAGIKSAINMADELGKLSQKVGITVEELQFLKYAAEISDLSMEGLTKGLRKLSTTMFEAGTGSKEARALFAGLGVEFEAAPGKLKPTDEVLLKLADTFQRMEDGPTKAALAVKLFGREGLSMIPFLNQGRDGIERLRGEFKSLAGVMTGEMAASAEKFNDSLKTLELSSKKLQITMANSMLPGLNDITMAMVEAAKESGNLMAIWVGMGGVMANLFKGASDETKLANTRREIAETQKLMAAYAARGDRGLALMQQQRLNALLAEEARLVAAIGTAPKPPAPKPKVSPPLDDFNTTEPKKTPSRMPVWEGAAAAWRDAYAQQMEEQGSAQQLSLQLERTYWKAVLDIGNLSSEERLAVNRKVYAIDSELRKQAFDGRIADLQAQMEAAQTTAEERINLANKVYMLEVQRHGAGAKEAVDALKKVQDAYDAWAKQRAQIANLQAEAEKDDQLARVELERQNLEALEQLGIITAADKIARLKELKEIEYTINLAELERQKELMVQGTVAYQEQLNKILALKSKNIADIRALDNQAAIESKKSTDQWLDPISQGFQQMISGIIAGTRKWTDVLRSTLASVAQQFAAMGVKMLVDWVKIEFAKTQATVASAALRTAAETTASGVSTASTAGTAIANISAKAWEAAASVYASISQMGPVGAFMAPAMAIAAAATVLGFIGKIASASGGFDIPAGMNPVTQLHGGEMVLPRELADRVRGVTGGDGGGSNIVINNHMSLMDSAGVARVLAKNGAVVKALKNAIRDGHR